MALIFFSILVFLSGFSGLLYEVTWQRFLATLVGAQAWATALVLAVYLGGLSGGYFLFGWLSHRWRGRLILVYGLVELGLGLWAFAFPTLFQAAFSTVPYWRSESTLWNLVLDTSTTALLLALPTVLMGGTLPLLTQALSPSAAEASRTHARIYGYNTLGACLGCLVTGYYLIPQYGLTVTTWNGGALNILVGLMAIGAARYLPRPAPSKNTRPAREALTQSDGILLGISFLSGFYNLAIQTGLIRLMGLSVGASNYAFSLVVSIFIFCLALGSLVARRMDAYKPERLFWNQALAAFAFLALYLTMDYWSYEGHVVRALLRDIPQGFGPYQTLLGGMLFVVLFIPLGLTGLTLPLCFHLAKRGAGGLGSRVGLLYGVNTLGCIAGALVGGYTLFYVLNLDQVFKLSFFCVALTAGLAAGLGTIRKQWRGWRLGAAAGLLSVTVSGLFFAPLFHKERFIQAFRHPQPNEATFEGAAAFGAQLSRNTKLVLWKDGPNTSVGVGASFYQNQEVSRTVFVNGKSDGNTRGDLLTTVMLGHLPGLLSVDPARNCVIGFGTGMTVGTLLHYPEVKKVDVVEISETILQNAFVFDPYNGNASTNDRVHFHQMDAMRFLGAQQNAYDVIISEPSNPWVSGVENLFSLEFYERARRALSPTGLLVQWIHAYSFTPVLFKMVLATVGRAFPYVSVFQLKGGDYALLASLFPLSQSDLLRGKQRYDALTEVRADLLVAGVPSYEVVLGLEVMGPAAVRQVAESTSDIQQILHPRLSDAAARAFFVGSSVDVDDFRRQYRAYYRYLDDSLLRQYLQGKPVSVALSRQFQGAFCQEDSVKVDWLCEEAQLMADFEADLPAVATSNWVAESARRPSSLKEFKQVPSRFGPEQLQQAYDRFEVFKKHASPIFYVSFDRLLKPVDACLKKVSVRSEVWGQCQLQKILLLEWVRNPSPELDSAKRVYLQWFPSLSEGSLNYHKLREARDILQRM